ncbi:nucleoside transporter C-terminal domain-containing protein [Pyruvatibacter mobilis]|uniref:NupC/NupG family nucleoside CNT transporter n=1 Tax=Pyruvatibacter mobilis TaxID=1712261 RepID=UPI00041D0949
MQPVAFDILHSLAGLGVLVALAWLMSENRRLFAWRMVLAGIAVQIVIAILFLRVPLAHEAMLSLNGLVDALMAATRAGTSFVFGYLGGGDTPFEVTNPGANFNLAFQSLPIVLVVSALAALLWHWRVLPVAIGLLSAALRRTLNTGGALGLASGANVFMGMVEAPILIRPYLDRLTRSELFALMSVGLATVAGTVLVLYASVIGTRIDGALGHIITASIISLPAAIIIARIMVPETATGTEVGDDVPALTFNGSMDAVVQGTTSGLQLLLSIAAMLIVAVALVAIADIALSLLPEVAGAPLTLERVLGWAFAPIAWCMGIAWEEAPTAGALMGTKTVLNEFLAYLALAGLEPGALSDRAQLIMVYALCGFANPGSVGIMIGGLTTLVPERRDEIIGMAGRAFVAGTLATCMTGAVVGLVA